MQKLTIFIQDEEIDMLDSLRDHVHKVTGETVTHEQATLLLVKFYTDQFRKQTSLF